MVSKYSRHIESLLNIHDCNIKYDEIVNTINSLYNDIVNKKIRLINQTDKTEEYYNLQERIPINFIGNMFIKDPEGNSYLGYNSVNISSVTFNPESLLERIEDYYEYILSNLKDLRREVSKDLYTYQRLNRLYFQFSNDDLNYLDDGNLFKYFNSHEKYNDENESEGSIAVSLFLFLMIQPLYVPSFANIANDFKFNCFTTSDSEDINITDDELNLTTRNVYDGFEDYISNNNTKVSSELANFLSSNIFVLNDPSDNFLNELSTVLSSFVETIGSKFEEIITVQNAYQQTIAVKTISSLAEYITINDIKTRKDYITISQEDDIVSDENDIHRNFNEVVRLTQLFNLTSLEFIIYQFREFPLYFLNGYFIAYNNYLNDILQDTTFMEDIGGFIATGESENSGVPNLTDWIGRINIDTNDFLSNMNNIDIPTEFENSNALEYNFVLFFIEIISEFVDSEEFHELIVVDLPMEIKDVSSYIKDYRNLIINNVGRIKLFIKILLIKEVIDKNLFDDLFSEFQTAFDEITPEYSSVNIESVVNSLKSPSTGVKKIYLKFVKGMFYSAHISSILNKVLNDYRL
jgi:hypothetical protein